MNVCMFLLPFLSLSLSLALTPLTFIRVLLMLLSVRCIVFSALFAKYFTDADYIRICSIINWVELSWVRLLFSVYRIKDYVNKDLSIGPTRKIILLLLSICRMVIVNSSSGTEYELYQLILKKSIECIFELNHSYTPGNSSI